MWPKKSAFFSNQTHPWGSQENLSVKKQRRRTVPWSGTSVMPHTAAGHSLPTGPLRRGTLWPHRLRPARGFPGRRPVGEAPNADSGTRELPGSSAPTERTPGHAAVPPARTRPPSPPGQRSPSPPGSHLLGRPAQVLQQAPQEVQQQRHGRTARRKEPRAGTPHASSPGWRHLSATGAGRKGSFANRETAVLSTANGEGRGRAAPARRVGRGQFECRRHGGWCPLPLPSPAPRTDTAATEEEPPLPAAVCPGRTAGGQRATSGLALGRWGLKGRS